MMYFSWNPGAIVDEAGHPLAAARVTVFVHDSNVPATVYTLEGDTYVNADNPQFLDDNGRLSATLFARLAVYDVKIEKANGDGTYEDFDVFEIGLDADLAAAGSNRVASVSDLMDVDPESIGNFVTVTDYPVRNYVWDAQSTDTPDGGVVVDSNVEGQGNWILLWEDEMLPCTVYGIFPGRESNIGAFLSFAETIGHWGIMTPRICRFEAGTYTSAITYTTNKIVYLDRGSRFNAAKITCPWLMAQPTADWYFHAWKVTNQMCPVNLSWFRDRDGFALCGAKVMNIDKDNTTGNTQVTLGWKQLNYYMFPPTWLKSDNCIQLYADSALIYADNIHASDLLRVGNYFKVVPHDDVMNPYYEFFSQGNMSYPTMRLRDDQNVLFHNGIEVKAGISIPAQDSYPQQWWGYFDGENGPQIQIKAEGAIKSTTLESTGNTTAGSLNVTNAASVGGKLSVGGNLAMTGHIVPNYGWRSDHRDTIVAGEDIDISDSGYKMNYPDGTIVNIVNYSNDTIHVTIASGSNLAIPGYSFRQVIKINGIWYGDYS